MADLDFLESLDDPRLHLGHADVVQVAEHCVQCDCVHVETEHIFQLRYVRQT